MNTDIDTLNRLKKYGPFKGTLSRINAVSRRTIIYFHSKLRKYRLEDHYFLQSGHIVDVYSLKKNKKVATLQVRLGMDFDFPAGVIVEGHVYSYDSEQSKAHGYCLRAFMEDRSSWKSLCVLGDGDVGALDLSKVFLVKESSKIHVYTVDGKKVGVGYR